MLEKIVVLVLLIIYGIFRYTAEAFAIIKNEQSTFWYEQVGNFWFVAERAKVPDTKWVDFIKKSDYIEERKDTPDDRSRPDGFACHILSILNKLNADRIIAYILYDGRGQAEKDKQPWPLQLSEVSRLGITNPSYRPNVGDVREYQPDNYYSSVYTVCTAWTSNKSQVCTHMGIAATHNRDKIKETMGSGVELIHPSVKIHAFIANVMLSINPNIKYQIMLPAISMAEILIYKIPDVCYYGHKNWDFNKPIENYERYKRNGALDWFEHGAYSAVGNSESATIINNIKRDAVYIQDLDDTIDTGHNLTVGEFKKLGREVEEGSHMRSVLFKKYLEHEYANIVFERDELYKWKHIIDLHRNQKNKPIIDVSAYKDNMIIIDGPNGKVVVNNDNSPFVFGLDCNKYGGWGSSLQFLAIDYVKLAKMKYATLQGI